MPILEENYHGFLIVMNDPPGAQSTLGSVLMKMAQETGGEELGLRS